MKKKCKRKASGCKIRIFLSLVTFTIIFSTLGYDCFINILKIDKLKDEKIVMNDKLDELNEEREILELDILKLKDEEYIARYVREKYYYSKDGELILKMNN